MLHIDQLNRILNIDNSSLRIVSLVPSQTELLHYLGLDEEVVGITKFCVHPANWFKSKVRVGDTKQVNMQKVKALNPNLIIANKEENTKEDIEQLEKIAPVWISDVRTLEQAFDMIEKVGNLVNRESQAFRLVSDIREQFSCFVKPKKVNRVLYVIWQNPVMVAGGDTFINAMLQKFNLHNVAEELHRYPELTMEQIQELKPEMILLSSEPFPFKEKHIKYFQTFLPNSEVKLVDGELFSWYGNRLLKIRALEKIFLEC